MHEELFKKCYEKDRDDVLSLYDYYAGFTSGCEAIINKACEWIKYNSENGGYLFDGWEEDFKKHMEE